MNDRWPPSELARLKALVVETGVAAGAALVRVAPAAPDEATRRRMEDAFARGDFATWGYDDRRAQTASDPRAMLAGARSVICLAVPYAAAVANDVAGCGRVSCYAWGEDYHRRVREIASRVAEALDTAVGEPVTAIACDTKPLAERAFAARAGIGWIGKHTGVIAPGYGSYIFLGEVVTVVPLTPDEPLRKTCGACTRCVTACPTGALRGDYTIDARRCIADLTQRTDGIPPEMRPLIGTWVWGCDLCQEICPPTQRARRAVPPPSEGDERERVIPDLRSLLRLRSGTFKRRFARSAMGWRGAAVLRRNAAVALGNSLDRAAVPALAQALREDPHPMVRGHAAWALGRIGSPRAIDALRAAAATEGDPSVLHEIAAALEPFLAQRTLSRA